MAPKNKKPEPKKYIGHLRFPHDLKIIDVFFKPPGYKTMYVLQYNGDTIQKSTFSKEFILFLKSIGYEYSKIKISETRRRPKHKFEDIPIAPIIEHNNQTDNDIDEIVVAYPSKSLSEMTERGKYILTKVYELTGILGIGDIYGKMEDC